MDVTPHEREFDWGDRSSDRTLDLLRDVQPSPDLSGRIMNRLGYMRAVESAARRQRVRRAAARTGVFLLMLATVVMAYQARGRSGDVRRPAEVTLPAALDQIGHDVTRQRERLGRMLQYIQLVAPDPVDPSAVPADEEDAPETPPLDDEVNRSGLLPYKWV